MFVLSTQSQIVPDIRGEPKILENVFFMKSKTGPLACLVLFSVKLWIRASASIWNYVFTQSCIFYDSNIDIFIILNGSR